MQISAGLLTRAWRQIRLLGHPNSTASQSRSTGLGLGLRLTVGVLLEGIQRALAILS